MIGRKDHRMAITLLMAVLLSAASGCAHLDTPDAPVDIPPSAEADITARGWRQARFKIVWPQGDPPAWHVDLYLAHRVIGPIMDRYGDRITLWRFHRRAARDTAGHRFRFLFYTDAATAAKIFERLGADTRLEHLRKTGIIETIAFDDTADPVTPGIDATSDPNWPRPIRNAWPVFIMGVSATWLDLIDQLTRSHPSEPASETEALERYAAVNRELTRLWREEGGHAFLHHLSAVFGYEPLNVVERRRIQF